MEAAEADALRARSEKFAPIFTSNRKKFLRKPPSLEMRVYQVDPSLPTCQVSHSSLPDKPRPVARGQMPHTSPKRRCEELCGIVDANDYSQRKAVIGSTLLARRAGMNDASKATAISTAATEA